jgi:hypothetical protein
VVVVSKVSIKLKIYATIAANLNLNDGRYWQKHQDLLWSATTSRLVEKDTKVSRCSRMMNTSLSPLLIDLIIKLAGSVVATGIIKGASLKAEDDCIDSMVILSAAVSSVVGIWLRIFYGRDGLAGTI